MSERLERIKRGLSKTLGSDSSNMVVRDLQWAVAEIERLQAIADRLPKTADGVPITLGMEVWIAGPCQWTVVAINRAHVVSLVRDAGCTNARPEACYSTQAAAEAAEEYGEALQVIGEVLR